MTDERDLLERELRGFHPEPGLPDRVYRRGEQKRRNQRIRAGVLGLAIAIAVAWLGVDAIRTQSEERRTRPAASTVASVVSGPPAPTLESVSTIDGVPFSLRVPTLEWERFGQISLNKSETGPQGAEAIIYWSSYPQGRYNDPYGQYAVPCDRILEPPIGPSHSDLLAAVAGAPGVDVVAGPSDVTVGGYPAKRMALTVRKDIGCDPGFFWRWRDVYGGALWTTTEVGSVIRVWIVDVKGQHLFIGAATSRSASSALDDEIEQIIASIRFDRS